MAGGFAVGSAMLAPAFDPQTTKRLRHFQTVSLPNMSAVELAHEAAQVEALPGPVAAELRRLVDAELEIRAAAARLGGAS
ncbi:hypothetical protein [Micromonospora chersina]